MTCCVAALADDRKTLVLIADRMIGNQVISAEADIQKFLQVHKNWWLMLADDPSPATAVALSVEKSLPKGSVDVKVIEEHFATALRERRTYEAEARFITPLNMHVASFFDSGRAKLGGKLFREIEADFAAYQLSLSLIIAGFDADGLGHILGVEGRGPRSLRLDHHSLVGYHAIGSGSAGANFIMTYKDLGPAMPARLVTYYAFEGKYFGELAHGVGTDTDIAIVRSGKSKLTYMGPRWVNKKLIPICRKLQPKFVRKKHANRLNKLARLERLSKIKKRDLQ